MKTIAEIEGMSCGMCEAHINDVIRRSFDIKSVKSSHKQNKAEIISASPIDEEKLRKAIADIGYQVISVQSEEYVKNRYFNMKSDLISKKKYHKNSVYLKCWLSVNAIFAT